MADQNKEFLQKLLLTFKAEAEEHLQDIVSNIVLLEQASESAQTDLVARILKKLHTLKGAARSVNLTDLETLCHAMEDVFSALPASDCVLAPEQFDTLHQAGNLARALSSEPSGRTRNQAGALIARLGRLSTTIKAGARQSASAPTAAEPDEGSTLPVEGGDGAIDRAAAVTRELVKTDVIRVQGRNLDAIRYQAEAFLSVELGLQQHINDLLTLADEMAEQRNRMRLPEPGVLRAMPRAQAATSASRGPDHDARARAVEPDRYSDSFELRCRHLAGALGRTRRNFALARSKLMDATLETALVPIASALEPLPGLVRNLARGRGKEAVLSIDGESTRIDRRIIDIVREALMHLVTNAVDHGIESIETRLSAGKTASGAVRIAVAQCAGNQVAVTVTDDGAGIDVEAVVGAATKSGFLDAGQLAGLSDQQKLHLALHSGVSTSSQVTQVSGRGVGLAIVAEKVASVGGNLSIENVAGAGCTFALVLPMRLATLRGLVLRARGTRYVIPLAGIESVRALKGGDIQTVENRETLLVGERVVPVVRLGHLLRVNAAVSPTDSGHPLEENIAVIARAGKTMFALLVDEILSEQEVLPKSLGKQLRRVRCIAGATQLGDGSLVPILGLEDIARYGLTAGDRSGPAGRKPLGSKTTKRLLVVEDSITSRLLLKHILEGAGYQVETAVDGLDALSRLRQGDFDAVISDVEMPQLDGLALAERIRGNSKTEEMPVILVTSLQSPEEKERGLRAGADAYVVKGSFDQDNLLKTIRRLI